MREPSLTEEEAQSPRSELTAGTGLSSQPGSPGVRNSSQQRTNATLSTPLYHTAIHTFLIINILEAASELIVPRLIAYYLHPLPLIIDLRSQGLLLALLSGVSYGVSRAREDYFDFQSVFNISISLYCLGTVGNLLLHVLSISTGKLDLVRWVRIIVHTFWMFEFAGLSFRANARWLDRV